MTNTKHRSPSPRSATGLSTARNRGRHCLLTALAAMIGPFASAQPSAPTFSEVYELVRSNLTAISDAELNRAALNGFLDRLAPRATLIGPASQPSPDHAAATEPMGQSRVFDEGNGYLRIKSVSEGLAAQCETALASLTSAHDLHGLVLDLRFAEGDAYQQAVRVASLFLDRVTPLLAWNGRELESTPVARPFARPVIVLVNGETAAAAEALAAILRHTEVALLIGARTAGKANVYREFPLSDGSRLRLAVASVQVSGGEPIPDTGIQPDIAVQVDPKSEAAFLDDPYLIVGGSPRGPRTPRVTEADLVRLQQGNLNEDPGARASSTESDVPLVTDPALARALDLLKGLAVVKASRDGEFHR